MPDIIPVPKKFSLNTRTQAQLIGMLHIPVTTILQSQLEWVTYLRLPVLKPSDLGIILKLQKKFHEISESISIPSFKDEFPGVIALSEEIHVLEEELRKMSFINYLIDRVLSEIELYLKNGITILQFENTGAPYHTRHTIPVEEQLIMNFVVQRVRRQYPDIPMGIQMLAFADNIALEIAIRNRLFYVRGESFLFQGIRPEGLTENRGNLAKAYGMRNVFNLSLNRENCYPRFYPDVLKKHTVFANELSRVETWLDNVLFEKLEGIILTGQATGSPVSGPIAGT